MANLKEADLFPFYIDAKKTKIISGKKYCSICKEYLTLDNFSENKCKYKGYDYWCKECLSLAKSDKLINYIRITREELRDIKDLKLIEHLKKFDQNLSIDHIIPVSSFKANKLNSNNINIINDYRNVVRISLKNNCIKSNKITIEHIPNWHFDDFKQYANYIIENDLISSESKKEILELIS